MIGTDEVQMPVMRSKLPEIGMAPLIDVVFLLLIFFMVTTVFPDEGIIIDKPGAEQTSRLIDNKLIITINQLGDVYYKKQALNLDDIKRLVADEIVINPDVAVIINVDKRALTERLVYVIDVAKSSGAEKIGIATDSKIIDDY